mmetsp:Transcript_65779/g.122653  ORF Transcript_65779/g.122653 Transcript_65779/m.122653 type:complete len:228 (-) Transcript_65779:501-1184(-)
MTVGSSSLKVKPSGFFKNFSVTSSPDSSSRKVSPTFRILGLLFFALELEGDDGERSPAVGEVNSSAICRPCRLLPHFMQKFASSGKGVLHRSHTSAGAGRFVPQFIQKLAPSPSGVLHCGQASAAVAAAAAPCTASDGSASPLFRFVVLSAKSAASDGAAPAESPSVGSRTTSSASLEVLGTSSIALCLPHAGQTFSSSFSYARPHAQCVTSWPVLLSAVLAFLYLM